jgi:aspartyl-tRNA(Asn)/glutamyl-tRNA(Gln) amidotransferase subunit C
VKNISIIFAHMDVNDALVSRLALLGRLHFTEEEKNEIRFDLQRMISFVDKLNELDTEGLEPVLHMSPEQNRLRKDEVKGSVSSAEALQNAPGRLNNFFTVPKVIKK